MDNAAADENYPSSQAQRGRRQIQGASASQQQQLSYPNLSSPGQQQVLDQQYQAAMEYEQDMLLRRQLVLEHDIQLRRRLMEEQHQQIMQEQQQQIMSELEHRQHLQRLQQLQQQQLSPLLQNQHLFELQQFLPGGTLPGGRALSLQEEQVRLQQQRQILLQHQQQMQQLMRPQMDRTRSSSVGSSSTKESSRPTESSTAGPTPSTPSDTPSTNQKKRSRAEKGGQQNDEVDPKPKRKNSAATQPVPPNKQICTETNPVESKDAPVRGKSDRAKAKPRKEEGSSEQTAKPAVPEKEQKKSVTAVNEGKGDSRDKLLNGGKKPDSVQELPRSRPRKDKPISEPANKEKTLEVKAKEDNNIPGGGVIEVTKREIELFVNLMGSEIAPEDRKALESGISLRILHEAASQENGHDRNTDKDAASLLVNLLHIPVPAEDKDPIPTERPPSPPPKEKLAFPPPKERPASPVSKERLPSPVIKGLTQPDEEQRMVVQGFWSTLPRLPIEADFVEGSEKELPMVLKDKGSRSTGGAKKCEKEPLQESFYAASRRIDTLHTPWFGEKDVTGPVLIKRREAAAQPLSSDAPVDTWWPSNNTIKRERRLRGYRSDEEDTEDEGETRSTSGIYSKPAMESLFDRLNNYVEPGVLEKLPHCKLHEQRVQSTGISPHPEPLFCFQVTETFCSAVMVCCSICSTWRHAECGGHYRRYSPTSRDPSNLIFSPICDRCHKEREFLREKPKAQMRMDRQRIENLRRANASTAVIRQASYAKHSGQYKWPLGSVSATHISGHTRSVHSRHERSEKQWNEMAMRLGNGLGYRPKERVRVRTRELERLLVSIEDAEGVTDRHNMMLFLQRDSNKRHPSGFEVPRRNFFDPADDESDEENIEEKPSIYKLSDEAAAGKAAAGSKDLNVVGPEELYEEKGEKVKETDPPTDKDMEPNASDVLLSTSDREDQRVTGPAGKRSDSDAGRSANGKIFFPAEKHIDYVKQAVVASLPGEITSDEEPPSQLRCGRPDCARKPRFDSIFCSDSCGVAALEVDLLHSFQYANNIHPSLLRP